MNFLIRNLVRSQIYCYLEVLQTEQAAFEAELSYAKTYRELLDAYVKFYKALGGGWLSAEEEQAAVEAAAAEAEKNK